MCFAEIMLIHVFVFRIIHELLVSLVMTAFAYHLFIYVFRTEVLKTCYGDYCLQGFNVM
jgi:hypothetical protein